MKNKIFKILPIIIIIAIIIAGLGIFINDDYSNKLLTNFLSLDYNLLYTSASLVIYAILSSNPKYEKISKIGILLCIINVILPFISAIINTNNFNIDLYNIINKIESILDILENCMKYSAILLLIDTSNKEANKYKDFAIKTQILIFIYQSITTLIDLDYEWILRISSSYTVLNGTFYLFTILFLIEKFKETKPQLHIESSSITNNQITSNVQTNVNQDNLFTTSIQTNSTPDNLFSSNIQTSSTPDNLFSSNIQITPTQENNLNLSTTNQENQFITPNVQPTTNQENQFIIPNIQPTMPSTTASQNNESK